MKAKRLITVIAFAIVGSGCLVEEWPEDDMGVVYQPVQLSNDRVLNGQKLNGQKLNGQKLNGQKLNGIELDNLSLVGSRFAGRRTDTLEQLSRFDFIDVEIEAVLEDLTTRKVRVKDIRYSGLADIDFFTVEYEDGGTWHNVCENGEEAIPVKGTWGSSADYSDDGSMFTFACRGAAIAKCNEWGYKRWGMQQECDGGNCTMRSLHDFHLACIRMVRADYCGDGVPHTQNGTNIDIYDDIGIMNEDTGYGAEIEAEWGRNGAKCIRHTRWEAATGSPEYQYIQDNCPERWAGPTDPTCGNTTSDFFTEHGYYTPMNDRRLLRNKSVQSIL